MEIEKKFRSYRFWLTKSVSAARLIADGLAMKSVNDLGLKDGCRIIGYGSGAVNADERIPPIFMDRGFFFAYLEYAHDPDNDSQTMEITVC